MEDGFPVRAKFKFHHSLASCVALGNFVSPCTTGTISSTSLLGLSRFKWNYALKSTQQSSPS